MHEADRARWNERFSGDDYLFGTQPNAFLVSQRHLLRRGQTALSVADGEGRNGVWLAEQGLDVLAVDFSEVALAKSRRLAAERGVRLAIEQADLFAWNWEGRSFDLVVAIFIQFATPAERPILFDRLKSAVRRGGHLLLQGYRPEQLQYKTGGPPQVEHMYTEELLRTAFADMQIVHLRAHDDVIQEGAGHGGMSALIDMVARK
ncbi:MAG TPA: class I SAM-dependent methyltransferase [Stellaceae bacterium]|nr:class I SAM-dependent methyltransferase [Stellaceae bacterium]